MMNCCLKKIKRRGDDMFKEYKFRKLSTARKKAKQMQRKYGYKPGVFQVTHPKTNKSFYAVIKPKGIKRIY